MQKVHKPIKKIESRGPILCFPPNWWKKSGQNFASPNVTTGGKGLAINEGIVNPFLSVHIPYVQSEGILPQIRLLQ